ncbi:50S ribosomal protein L11 methyltransferase, partial [Pseudoxanthomonas sp. SGD-10]
FIRATFHEPRHEFPYEIVIEPKMSFGTGHHQTTKLMLEWLLGMDVQGKTVLDMGCGTAILGILAAKLGALAIDAIDYDEVCYISAKENAALNKVSLTAFCGSKEVIPNKKYDILLANINRNILLDQIERYSEVIQNSGVLLLSGFYEDDLEILIQKAEKHNFKYDAFTKLDNWVSAKFIYKP